MTPRVRIKDLPRSKRPRERFLTVGPDHLSDDELVAIVFGTGTRGRNVLSVSQSLLKAMPLKQLAGKRMSDMKKVMGVGTVYMMKLLCAVEIGKRIWTESAKSQIITPDDVVSVVQSIRDKEQEHMMALYLNARHELLTSELIAVGSLNQAVITPRDVLAPALRLPCVSIIVTHNHPSGDATPSQEDIQWTKKLVQAADIVGLGIIDHVIVTRKSYVSFKQQRLL